MDASIHGATNRRITRALITLRAGTISNRWAVFPPGASPYGALDMAGNGWEWVSSEYKPYPYDARDGREDPHREVVRVTRGGGQDARPEELTTSHRGRHVSRNPRGGHHNISFRCAR